MSKNTILVVGGTGYIGSHVALEVLQLGYRVIVLDNLSNSYQSSLGQISKIVFDRPMDDPITKERFLFYKVDISDYQSLKAHFNIFGNEILGVIHLAGLKSVSDSFKFSLTYYNHNLTGTINLCRCMEEENITNIIFSSSASVYGIPRSVPIYETATIDPISVYGDTKVFGEKLLHTLAENANWTVITLRYFNPYGAHDSGLLGEHQKKAVGKQVPNLIEIMTEAALGQRDEITIYGQSHSTPDGTPIRDFIHIVDLAKGHCAALKLFGTKKEHVFNLGTGVGTTILQAIQCFSTVCKREIKVKYADERKGDPPILIANCDKANQQLNWKAEKDFMSCCRDYWKFLQLNPKGYHDY